MCKTVKWLFMVLLFGCSLNPNMYKENIEEEQKEGNFTDYVVPDLKVSGSTSAVLVFKGLIKSIGTLSISLNDGTSVQIIDKLGIKPNEIVECSILESKVKLNFKTPDKFKSLKVVNLQGFTDYYGNRYKGSINIENNNYGMFAKYDKNIGGVVLYANNPYIENIKPLLFSGNIEGNYGTMQILTENGEETVNVTWDPFNNCFMFSQPLTRTFILPLSINNFTTEDGPLSFTQFLSEEDKSKILNLLREEFSSKLYTEITGIKDIISEYKNIVYKYNTGNLISTYQVSRVKGPVESRPIITGGGGFLCITHLYSTNSKFIINIPTNNSEGIFNHIMIFEKNQEYENAFTIYDIFVNDEKIYSFTNFTKMAKELYLGDAPSKKISESSGKKVAIIKRIIIDKGGGIRFYFDAEIFSVFPQRHNVFGNNTPYYRNLTFSGNTNVLRKVDYIRFYFIPDINVLFDSRSNFIQMKITKIYTNEFLVSAENFLPIEGVYSTGTREKYELYSVSCTYGKNISRVIFFDPKLQGEVLGIAKLSTQGQCLDNIWINAQSSVVWDEQGNVITTNSWYGYQLPDYVYSQ